MSEPTSSLKRFEWLVTLSVNGNPEQCGDYIRCVDLVLLGCDLISLDRKLRARIGLSIERRQLRRDFVLVPFFVPDRSRLLTQLLFIFRKDDILLESFELRLRFSDLLLEQLDLHVHGGNRLECCFGLADLFDDASLR